MSRQKILGLLTLGVGGALGLVIREPIGLGVVAVFLVVGLGLLFASEARGLIAPGGPHKPRILILLKEIHARPQRGGKFQQIVDNNQTGLQFEVFIRCWLVNESDFPVQLGGDLQLSVDTPRRSRQLAERIWGDMSQWRLGSLVRDEWDTDTIRARQESMPELDISPPLQCGVPRHGWVHFRLRELSPAEFRTGVLRLSVKDSRSNTHEGIGKARHLPGRVWPAVSAPTIAGEKAESGAPSTETDSGAA